MRGRPHTKKNMKVKTEGLHTDYYSSEDHSSDLGEEPDPLKLIEPSPSSDSHEKGGLPSSDQVTMALTMDCPTIAVHTGKCCKALIDSGASISLIRYSTYQTIDSSFKTPIQATMTKLNTTDGSPMTVLGIMALQLRIVDFKLAHKLIICDRLQVTEITIWN